MEALLLQKVLAFEKIAQIMSKRLSLALVVLAILPLVARGQVTNSIIVNYAGGSGIPNIVDSTDTALPNTDPNFGLTVEVGYFSQGFDIQSHANDLTQLKGAWNQFGPGTSIQTTVLATEPGSFGSSSAQSQVYDPLATDGGFANQPLDLWVFKTID